MTAMATIFPPGEIVETADHRVQMHEISWEHYEQLLEMRGERPQPRMSYLDGELELMTTSEDHERITNWIARLAETYLAELGIEFSSYGHYTQKEKLARAGLEPDQCYRIGLDQTRGRSPDLAIEVNWTRGGIHKLEIYRRLGVREVWFWQDDEISVHTLIKNRYVVADASAVVPGVDLELLASFIDEPLMSKAVRDYRAALATRRT